MQGYDYDVISWADIQRMEDGVPFESPSFIPGVDFDPNDPDEVEIIGFVTENHAHDRITRLEKENAELRGQLAEITGYEDHEYEDRD
jgi:hypothetical protein